MEKKPLTFEKDKEDQSKYYLSYPKPPVLDIKKSPVLSIKRENCRSSRLEVFCRKDAFRNFAKFTGKHLYQGLFFNKVAGQGLQLY